MEIRRAMSFREAARVGKEAHFRFRRGYWFLPKTLFGQPSAESWALYLPIFLQRVILKLIAQSGHRKIRRLRLAASRP